MNLVSIDLITAVNNTTNQRKRGRETSAATEISPSILPFSLQQQSQPPPPQLIDLSQLHSHNHNNPNVVSTGLRLSFGDQQQQQQQQQQQFQQHHNQQQQQQQSSALFSVLTEDFAAQIKHQRDELDQFLQAQVVILTFLKWVISVFLICREKAIELNLWFLYFL